jgi:hypothetical protein
MRELTLEKIAAELGYSVSWTRKLHADGIAEIEKQNVNLKHGA